jgi:hypothetical protein
MTSETRFEQADAEGNVPTVTLRIRVKSNEAIQNVLLTVHVHSPLCAQPNEVRMGHVGGAYISFIKPLHCNAGLLQEQLLSAQERSPSGSEMT